MGFLSYFTAVFLAVYAAILMANVSHWLFLYGRMKWRLSRMKCEMCGSKKDVGVKASLSIEGVKHIVLCAECLIEEGEVKL